MNKLHGLMGTLALALASQTAAAACLHYDSPSVHISGRISRAPFKPQASSSGPSPADYAWYFTTAEPVCIAAGDKRMGNVPFASVQHFEILLPTTGRDLSRLVGASVVLKGQFLASQLPHYHQLTFQVESAWVQHAP